MVLRKELDIIDPQLWNEVERDFADQTAVIPPAAGPAVRKMAVEEPVVDHNGQMQIGFALEKGGQVDFKRQEGIFTRTGYDTIDKYLGTQPDTFKPEKRVFVGQRIGNIEITVIPAESLPGFVVLTCSGKRVRHNGVLIVACGIILNRGETGIVAGKIKFPIFHPYGGTAVARGDGGERCGDHQKKQE